MTSLHDTATASALDEAARAICADRAEWWEQLQAFNSSDAKTGDQVDEIMRASDAIDARVEQLRKEFYPGAHRLVVSDGTAITVSRTARSIRTVWTDNGSTRSTDGNDWDTAARNHVG